MLSEITDFSPTHMNKGLSDVLKESLSPRIIVVSHYVSPLT